MTRIKKATYKSLTEQLKTVRELNEEIRHSERLKNFEIQKLQNKLTERIETSMMKERIELARALGQMMEATSKAVLFIIAKESI